MTTLKQFLADLLPQNTLIQIGSENRVFEAISSPDEETVKKCLDFWSGENMYCLGCVSDTIASKIDRASDSDIKKKNYFYLDIDVRKNHPSVTDEEIKGDCLKDFKELLSMDEDLKDWRYIIYTGNGLHIYYVFDAVEISDKNVWKQGVSNLVDRAQALIGEDIDHACINVARIGRLPMSKNQKSDPPKDVVFVGFQDIKTTLGTKIMEKGKKKLEEMRVENEKRASEMKLLFPLEIDTYKAVQSLPIANIVCILFGWTFDGKHFFAAGSNNKSGCFVPEGENYLVHGGTSHIPATQTGFRPFELVKAVKGFENPQVFEWFKEKFPEIADVSDRERQAKEEKLDVIVPTGSIMDVFNELSTNNFELLEIGHGFDEHKFLIRGAITRVGAYSNIGKSKFTYWLTHLLLKRGYKGIMFSTEVPRHIVLANMLNIQTGQHFWDIMYRRYTPPAEVQKLYEHLSIYDVTHTMNALPTYEKIINEVQKGPHPVDFVIIDFVQGVSPRGSGSGGLGGEYDQMSKYALEVQSLAQRLNICVIDVSQISNEGIKDEHAASGMIPFKGSGHLYSSADIGILLKRDKKSFPNLMEVHVRKHKYAPPSFFQMDCHWPNGSFSVLPHGTSI